MKQFVALLVDDNEVNLVLGAGLLRQMGGVVHTADSGPRALEMIGHTTFDIILLDHLMPGMDGIETARQIRQVLPHVPILALSASIDNDAHAFFVAHGFDDYIAKPMDPADFRHMLARHLPGDNLTVQAADDAPSEAMQTALGRISALNLAEAVAVCDNSWTLYLEVARSFADSIGTTTARIQGLLDKADYGEAAIEFHALRAALSNVGCQGLAALSTRLEKGCCDNPPDFVARNAARFLSTVAELGRQFDSALSL